MVRESWRTRTGFILAAVGSAVGLGNLWRFPWMTADNGGAAFLALYVAVVFLVGVPALLAELVIGRRANRNPVGALESLSGSRNWRALGLFAVGTSVVLLSFYSVVGGWILRYVAESATGAYFQSPGAHFSAISSGPDALAFHALFLALTAGIVVGGVRDGIERAAKLMLPAIVALMVGLAAWAFTLDGAARGVSFFLDVDIAYLRANFLDVLVAAAGQALFTLSIGCGTMLTYASYLGEDRSLPADGATIGVLNTLVGVLAGFLVFPLLFALVGDAGSGGPGALFVSLAGAFGALPAGRLVGFAFFGVVALAALSSAISILEIPVAYLVDEHGIERRRAVVGLVALFLVTGGVCALDSEVFAFVANTLVNILLTAGLVGFLLFVGWVLGRDALGEYGAGGGSVALATGRPWLAVVAVVLPVFLLFTLVTTVLGAAGITLPSMAVLGVTVAHGHFALAIAAVLALASFFGLRGPRSVL
jgi:NSS family neurotransmitter:Na+ symporter